MLLLICKQIPVNDWQAMVLNVRKSYVKVEFLKQKKLNLHLPTATNGNRQKRVKLAKKLDVKNYKNGNNDNNNNMTYRF